MLQNSVYALIYQRKLHFARWIADIFAMFTASRPFPPHLSIKLLSFIGVTAADWPSWGGRNFCSTDLNVRPYVTRMNPDRQYSYIV